jgi:hypothetical protein
MTSTTETVQEFRSKQVVFPDWMQQAVEGLADTDTVTVTREHTAFGTFVMAVTR